MRRECRRAVRLHKKDAATCGRVSAVGLYRCASSKLLCANPTAFADPLLRTAIKVNEPTGQIGALRSLYSTAWVSTAVRKHGCSQRQAQAQLANYHFKPYSFTRINDMPSGAAAARAAPVEAPGTARHKGTVFRSEMLVCCSAIVIIMLSLPRRQWWCAS